MPGIAIVPKPHTSAGEVTMATGDWADRFGSVASAICAVHCAICAFLPVIFSAAGLGFLLGPRTEWTFAIVAILFGLGALAYGWPQHRSRRIAGLLVAGIVGLMVSRGLEMGVDHHDHGAHAAHHGEEEDAHGEHGHDAEEGAHAEDHHATEEGAHGDDHHEEDEDLVHLAGALVGVLAGLTLLIGHISNLRAIRRCREECCD